MRYVPVGICAAVLLSAVLRQGGLSTNVQLRQRSAVVEGEIAEIRSENENLRQQLDALNTQPHRRAALVREHLNGVMDGETLFVFVNVEGERQ